MTATVHTTRPVTADDRLGVTLFLAIALHAIIILGTGFGLTEKDDTEEPELPTLEITLVNTRSNETPEDADYLAQANQAGGGNTEEKTRPSAPPTAAPNELPSPGNAQTMQPPVPERQEQTRPLHRDALSVANAEAKVLTGDEVPREQNQQPTATDLIQKSLEIAQLEAELAERTKVFSKRKREKLLNPQSMSSAEAAYFDSWIKKVELVGNMNYPEEAKRQNISGSLILEVAINTDGSLNEVKLIRSSGHKVLDDAAIRIAKIASPYAPLPDVIRRETDVLRIIRGWIFPDSNTLRMQ